MKYTLSVAALALGASAAFIPASCTFSLTASGGANGVVGQLGDGQNRVGGSLPKGTYSISNGQITDSHGRGCILTPPTTQFQCDVGATPTGGFALGSNGAVTYQGSTTFYACPATTGEYNIYTTPVKGQNKCVEIQLSASNCYAAPSSTKAASSKASTPAQQSQTTLSTVSATKPAPVQTQSQSTQASCPAPVTVTVTKAVQQSCPAPQTVTVTAAQQSSGPASKPSSVAPAPQGSSPAPAAPQKSSSPASKPASQSSAPAPQKSSTSNSNTCPLTLSSSYQYPHLIVPVSSSSPSKAYGTSYNGKISSDTSSIFNFDIPSSYTGTCSLIFGFPEQSQLQTSSYTFSGNGAVDFKELSSVASQSTTYANQGGVKTDFGSKTLTPGSETVVSTFKCPAGETVSYELSSVSGTSLEFFQDYNPCPIGLYVISN